MEKSMPMMETFPNCSMVAVYKKRGELKFVHLKSEKFLGRFTILIFMDDKLTEMEIDEWKDFSNHVKEFKQAGAYVVGVCTDSHISMRAMMMNSLSDITFPIISDRDGDFSRSFGVLKVKNGKFGAARALVILDSNGRMVHLTLHNEHTRSYPVKVMELIKHLKDDISIAIDESTESLKSLSMSTVIIDEPSKVDESEGPKEVKKIVNKDVAKKEDLIKKAGDEKKDNVAEKDSSKEGKEEKKIVSNKSKENKNKTTASKNTKVRKENKMSNSQKHSSDKKAPVAAQSNGHKKPSAHNWIEAGAPLSQD